MLVNLLLKHLLIMSIGVDIEHLLAHTHTQNSLEESLIKHIQLIARPLLMKTKIRIFA